MPRPNLLSIANFFIFLTSCMVLTLILNRVYQDQNQTFPFEKKDFLILPPQFTQQKKKLAKLGKNFFFDKSFSKNGKIACSSCHQPEHGFADNKSFSRGIKLTTLNSPSVVNTFNQKWFFWDGRVDSLQAQALQPIENPGEHGFSRLQLAKVILTEYQTHYEEALREEFPEDLKPLLRRKELGRHNITIEQQESLDRVFLNFGKAIGQFEKGLIANESPFDKFLREFTNPENPPFRPGFGEDEWAGMQIFLGKGLCVECHSGPFFTDNDFHFTGLTDSRIVDRKRGIALLTENPFGCLNTDCESLKKISDLQENKLKTPTLRNVALTAPYFHDGSAPTLKSAINRYLQNTFPKDVDKRVKDISLNVVEVDKLIKFLHSLTSPIKDLSETEYRAQVKPEN